MNTVSPPMSALRAVAVATPPLAGRVAWVVSRLATWGASVAVALATLALAGWGSGFHLLASLGGAGAPMTPVTAVGVLLCGAALFTLTHPRPRWRAAGFACAVAAALIGLLTLLQYVAEVGLGLDPAPGRPSPAAALNLLLLGLATAAMDARPDQARLVQAAALAALVVGVLSTLGRSYGGALEAMSLSAALASVALATGILCARADSGWMAVLVSDGPGGQILRALLPVVVLGPAALDWLRIEGQALGLFDFRFGVALLALANVALLTALVIWGARRVARVDADLRRTHAALLEREARLDADSAARREAELARERYAERLRVVKRLDRVISSTFDLETVYDILVDELKRLFLFDRTSLIVLSPDKSRWQIVRQWTRAAPALEVKRWHEVHGSCLEWLVEHRSSYVGEVGKGGFAEEAALAEEGLRSRTLAPLIFGGEILGALTLESNRPPGSEPEDVAIMESLADQIAIALNNARLFEQVQRQAALLERRVRERTAQLEAAVKDLEGFSYSVSHDLRAPLRAIDSFSDIVLQEYAGQLDAEGRRLLGVVRENTAKMGQLIEDILAFSRAGRRDLVLAEVDVDSLVAEILAELGPQIGKRHIDFRLAPLPSVAADRAALRQALANLLSNAVKFTRGRQDAWVEVSAVAGNEDWTLSVRDNGAGFDPHYAHKLFGVFQRLHTAAEFEGTGIGLAIVKRIVEKHGGKVRAEGSPGGGAAFHLSLPRLVPGGAIGEAHG